MQLDMFDANRPLVMGCYGGGVDSTAMLIELIARGETIDQVLMAQTLSENPLTDIYAAMFGDWLREKGVPFEFVRYQPKNFKNFPGYDSLYTNCLVNGTLPSITFGFSSCSLKWKVAPQNSWTNNWEPAASLFARGGKIIKLIGYDSSPADSKRYAEREGHTDPRYEYRYPLREWGWTRDDCIERIKAEGLPVPQKSACYVCAATKPFEVDAFPPVVLRRIVLLEARAHPRLRNVEGLWRKEVKGTRGGTKRPGSMTQYIREQGLLPEAEIDLIWNEAPKALIKWLENVADIPIEDRPHVNEWVSFFDKHHALFEGDGCHPMQTYPISMEECRHAA